MNIGCWGFRIKHILFLVYVRWSYVSLRNKSSFVRLVWKDDSHLKWPSFVMRERARTLYLRAHTWMVRGQEGCSVLFRISCPILLRYSSAGPARSYETCS